MSQGNPQLLLLIFLQKLNTLNTSTFTHFPTYEDVSQGIPQLQHLLLLLIFLQKLNTLIFTFTHFPSYMRMCPRASHIPSSQIGEETIPSEWISLYISVQREKHNFNNMNIFCPMHALYDVNDTFVHHATGHLPAPASWAVRAAV